VLVAVSLWSVCTRPAQAQACNNLTRTKSTEAGYHNAQSEHRSQLTITVAGQPYPTPAQCPQGYAYYRGTVYTCGPAATSIHCKAQSNKVYIDLATGGGCPDITGLNPGTWSSWAVVPSAIIAAFRCKKPTVTQTFDWSASTSNCGSGVPEPPPDVGQEQTGSDGQVFVRLLSDPRPALPSTQRNPFEWAYDTAQTGTSEELPTPLRTAFTQYGSVLGVQVLANVTYEYRAADGTIESSRTASISGKVWRDGRFDVSQVEAVMSPDGRLPVSARLVFNGSGLYEDINETEEARAYGFVGSRSATTFSLLTRFVEPVYRWVRNPLEVALFPDAVYESSVSQDGTITTVSRRVGTGVDATISDSHELEITAAGVRPKSWSVRLPTGGPCVLLTFADHRTLATDVWRPFRITNTYYLDGTASGRKLTTTLEVQRAVPVTSTEMDPWPFASDRIWCMWK
jgi:hypothetical protein